MHLTEKFHFLLFEPIIIPNNNNNQIIELKNGSKPKKKGSKQT